MKNAKRLICALVALALCLPCALADSPATLSFSASNELEELNRLNGQSVTIIGYMATISPISGEFMYLMNLPYQSCPFCVPNTTQLANTMAVYARKGQAFEYTDLAIRVNGTLRVEDYEDEFGYQYNYRIVDAEYETVDLSQVSSEYALWTALAADGVTADIYAMFDYLYFICQWQDYNFNYIDDDGNRQTVPIWPGDVMNLLEDDVYGYKNETDAAYFERLIARVRAVSRDELEDLVDILKRCEQVRARALDELYSENFYYIPETDGYGQNAYDELYLLWADVYQAYTVDWISKWQL